MSRPPLEVADLVRSKHLNEGQFVGPGMRSLLESMGFLSKVPEGQRLTACIYSLQEAQQRPRAALRAEPTPVPRQNFIGLKNH
jgi:hypothetical protein